MRKIILLFLSAVLLFSCTKEDERLDQIITGSKDPIAEFGMTKRSYSVTEGDTSFVTVVSRVNLAGVTTATLKITGAPVYGTDFKVVPVKRKNGVGDKINDEFVYDKATGVLILTMTPDLHSTSVDFAEFGILCTDDEIEDAKTVDAITITLESVTNGEQTFWSGKDTNDATVVNLVDDDCSSDLAGIYTCVCSGSFGNKNYDVIVTKMGEKVYNLSDVFAGYKVPGNFNTACGNISGLVSAWGGEYMVNLVGSYDESKGTINLTFTTSESDGSADYKWYYKLTRK